MQKRKLWYLSGITVVIVAAAVTLLGVVLKHEPNSYCQSQVPASEERQKQSLMLVSNFGQMLADIEGKQEHWGCDISEIALNCFFHEAFTQRGEAESLRKLGISSPSFTLEDDHVRLAFRYGSDWFSTVISYDLHIWLVPKEANVIAVEIRSARAGAMPISSHTILHRLSEFAREQNCEVNLFRHEGKSVAIIRLQPGQFHPTWILTTLKVNSNMLAIRGKTPEHALPPPIIKSAKVETPG